MRMGLGQGTWMALAVAGMLVAGAGGAHACLSCSSDLYCIQSDRGAMVCIGNGSACMMGGRCRPGWPGPYYGDAYAMIQLSVLEDAAGAGFTGRSRVLRGAGPLGVGRHAARLAREAAGGAGAEPAIVFSGVGSGDGASVAFRSRRGDGFTFRRDADGRGARVTVRALVAGRPAMPLARETLGEHDALAVRVTLDGRPRIVIVQVPTLERAEGEALEREARFALAGANGARFGEPELPFELTPVDD